MDATAGRSLPPTLFYGLAVASIGGPLALAVIYVPGAADMRSAGLVTLLGAALYAAPLLVWLRFSRDVVSPAGSPGSSKRRPAGGRAGPGSGLGVLLLPLPAVHGHRHRLRDARGRLPGHPAVAAAARARDPDRDRRSHAARNASGAPRALVSAALQLGILVVLGAAVIHHVGAPAASFTHARGLRPGAANIALLFVCGSLPLFLGAEVTGGSRTIRRALPIAGDRRRCLRALRRLPVRGGRPGAPQRRASRLRDRRAPIRDGRSRSSSASGGQLSVAGLIVPSTSRSHGFCSRSPALPFVSCSLDRRAVRRLRRAEPRSTRKIRRARPAPLADRAVPLTADRLRASSRSTADGGRRA